MSAAPLASSPATGPALPPLFRAPPPLAAPSYRRNGAGIAAAVLLHLALLVALTAALLDARPAESPPTAMPMVATLITAEPPAAPTPSAQPAPRPEKTVAKPTPPAPPSPRPRTTERPTAATTPAGPAAEASPPAAAPSSSPPSAVAPSASPALATAGPSTTAPTVVVAPRFDAAYLANPAPPYPSASRKMGEEGRVLLRVQVGADGMPTEVTIARSSGYPRLDEVARDTVLRSWRFVPARQGAQPVAGAVKVPIDFTLTSAS